LPNLLEGGGYFVAPGDADSLVAGMRALLDDGERDRRGRIARERAARLTWRASARATLSALHDVAALTRRAAPVPAVS
jgi:glycosyltransferase involved in cell wall biosynthesis